MLPFSFTPLLQSAGRLANLLKASLRQAVIARPLALLAVPVVLGSSVLFGCGGSGSSTAVANSPAAALPGRYISSIPLGGGQVGNLDMTVADTGAAMGVLTIDDGIGSGRAATQPTRAVVATYMVSGFADLRTGTFQVNGTVLSASKNPIRISGTLPFSAGASSLINLLFNSKSYSGSLSRTGSGSITGTVGTGPNSTVNFAGATGTNANTASFSGVTAVAIQNLPIIGSTASIVVGLPSGQRMISITINATLTAGAIFVPGDDNTIVQYIDGSKIWAGTGGQVIIDAVNGTSVTFRVLNTKMSPYPVIGTGPSASGSTGTFTLSVNATATATTTGGNTGGNPTPNSLLISSLTANTTIAQNGAFTGTGSASKYVDQYTFDFIKDTTVTPQTDFSGDIFVTTATVGQTINLADPAAANLTYSENGKLFFSAVSGTETIDAVSATSITVTFHNVQFQPQSAGTGSSGGFILNGTFTAPVTAI